jgi:hypothetical protein
MSGQISLVRPLHMDADGLRIIHACGSRQIALLKQGIIFVGSIHP